MNKNSKVRVPYSPDLHLSSLLSDPKLSNVNVLKLGEKQRQLISRLR